MSGAGLTYTRFELRRTVRNRRFFILSLAFPVVLYFLIAGPNHDVNDFANTGISAPLSSFSPAARLAARCSFRIVTASL